MQIIVETILIANELHMEHVLNGVCNINKNACLPYLSITLINNQYVYFDQL